MFALKNLNAFYDIQYLFNKTGEKSYIFFIVIFLLRVYFSESYKKIVQVPIIII